MSLKQIYCFYFYQNQINTEGGLTPVLRIRPISKRDVFYQNKIGIKWNNNFGDLVKLQISNRNEKLTMNFFNCEIEKKYSILKISKSFLKEYFLLKY